MEEARFSFNVKFQVSGLEAQLTCRAGEGEALGSFRETILGAVRMVKSLGEAPRAPVSDPAPAAAAAKERPEPIRPQDKSCPVCKQSDKLRLIEFTPPGSQKSMYRYKCERCDKWLKYIPSEAEITAFRQQPVKDLVALWG